MVERLNIKEEEPSAKPKRGELPQDTVSAKSPATSVDSVAKLIDRRDVLEKNLAPDKKEKLELYRQSMSCTDVPSEQKKYKELIDSIDPSLTKANSEIEKVISFINPYGQIKVLNDTGQKHLPAITVPRDGDNAGGLAKELEKRQRDFYAPYREAHEFASRNNLELGFKRDGEKVKPEFHLLSEGKIINVPLDASKDLQTQLDKFVETKITELETNYNVHIARADEKITKILYDDKSGNFLPGHLEIPAKQPSLFQLAGIEEGLKVAIPSLEGAKVTFAILSSSVLEPYKGEEGNDALTARYWSDAKGVPFVGLPDYKPADLNPQSQASGEEPFTIKGITIHELEHKMQAQTGFNNDRRRIEQRGWVKLPGENAFGIMAGNKCFRRVASRGEFFRCDKQTGKPLDQNGHEVSEKKAEKLSFHEIRPLLSVQPVTEYGLKHPEEMGADSQSYYRSGAVSRAKLAMANRGAYEATKEDDQKEIDKYYARKYPGKLGIRLPDGSIVDKTPETEKQVSSFESLFNKPVMLAQNMQDSQIKLDNLPASLMDQSAPLTDLVKQSEQLLQKVDSLKPDEQAMEKFIANLEQSKSAKELKSLIDEQKKILKDYRQLRGNTLVESSILEFAAGHTDKAQKLLDTAANYGHTSEVNLSGTRFDEEVIGKFLNLKGLEKLTIDNNDTITDKTLAGIGQLGSLKELTMWDLPTVTSSGLDQLKKLKSLEILDMRAIGNGLNPSNCLEQLTGLKKLSLSQMPLQNGDLEKLSGLPELRDLDFNMVNLNDAALAKIKNLPRLKNLSIADPITDQGLKNLAGAKTLETLNLTSDKINGDGLTSMTSLPNLRILNLTGTQIPNKGLDNLRGMTNLRNLSIMSLSVLSDEKIEALKVALPNCSVDIIGSIGTPMIPGKSLPEVQ